MPKSAAILLVSAEKDNEKNAKILIDRTKR
jgi:hypothetical protein